MDTHISYTAQPNMCSHGSAIGAISVWLEVCLGPWGPVVGACDCLPAQVLRN